MCTVPFVCLFNAPQLRIRVLPCMIHSHGRAKHHLDKSFKQVSVAAKYQRTRTRGGPSGQSRRGGHARPRCSLGTPDQREHERTLFLEPYAPVLPAPRVNMSDFPRSEEARSLTVYANSLMELASSIFFIRPGQYVFHEVSAGQ